MTLEVLKFPEKKEPKEEKLTVQQKLRNLAEDIDVGKYGEVLDLVWLCHHTSDNIKDGNAMSIGLCSDEMSAGAGVKAYYLFGQAMRILENG